MKYKIGLFKIIKYDYLKYKIGVFKIIETV